MEQSFAISFLYFSLFIRTNPFFNVNLFALSCPISKQGRKWLGTAQSSDHDYKHRFRQAQAFLTIAR
jgi:hypothetical protein